MVLEVPWFYLCSGEWQKVRLSFINVSAPPPFIHCKQKRD